MYKNLLKKRWKIYKFDIDKSLEIWYNIFCYRLLFAGCCISRIYALVAELADAPDLGSGVNDVGVQVPSAAPPFRTCRIYFCKFFTLADKSTDKSYFACRLVFFGRDSRLPKQFTGLFWLRLVFSRTTFKTLIGFSYKCFDA